MPIPCHFCKYRYVPMDKKPCVDCRDYDLFEGMDDEEGYVYQG